MFFSSNEGVRGRVGVGVVFVRFGGGGGARFSSMWLLVSAGIVW